MRGKPFTELPTELVPVPLPPRCGARRYSIGRSRRHALFAAILADSGAALLGHGLAGLDDETLDTSRTSRAVAPRRRCRASLRHFCEQPACARGAHYGAGRRGRSALWEAIVGEKVRRPTVPSRTVYRAMSGHLAYLYDLVASLDAPRGAFALGLWVQNDRDPIERFKFLAADGAFCVGGVASA